VAQLAICSIFKDSAHGWNALLENSKRTRKTLIFFALVVTADGKVWSMNCSGTLALVYGPYFAEGSGAKYAMGAMAAGATAAEAVAIAIRYDAYSGGEIQTLTL
jgi:20S proteasome alpha/beta subunit